jgi:hypothetical protein
MREERPRQEDLRQRTPLLQGWVVREWGGLASDDSGGLQSCQQIEDGDTIPVAGAGGTLCLEGDKTSRYHLRNISIWLPRSWID